MDVLVSLYYKLMDVSCIQSGDPCRDRFVLSKGHCAEALYAVLADTGFIAKEELLTFTRFGTRLAEHPTKSIPGIEIATGALGHGLSAAVGMALALQMDGLPGHVYCLMGDGEQAEGSVWEAAMAAAKFRLDNLTAIVDRNRLQISGCTDDVMPSGDLSDKYRAFGWNAIVCDGHDFEQLLPALQSRAAGLPTVVIAETVKGRGSQIMENIAEWHHQIPTSEEYAQIKADLTKIAAGGGLMSKVSCRKAFTDRLTELARTDKHIVAIATDSRGSVTLSGFAKEHPDRFIECGIAEQNAVAIAAGIAKSGKCVFVTGPACFLAARAFEQVKVDVAYNKTNVKIIGVSSGVSYGPLGGTHTSTHDLASMRALPNIIVLAPSDNIQTAALTEQISLTSGPVYMRMGRGDVEGIYSEGETFKIGRAKTVRDGNDITIIACGETVWHALQAAAKLAEIGVSVRVLDMFTIKPLDDEAVRSAAKETKAIITIEGTQRIRRPRRSCRSRHGHLGCRRTDANHRLSRRRIAGRQIR